MRRLAFCSLSSERSSDFVSCQGYGASLLHCRLTADLCIRARMRRESHLVLENVLEYRKEQQTFPCSKE